MYLNKKAKNASVKYSKRGENLSTIKKKIDITPKNIAPENIMTEVSVEVERPSRRHRNKEEKNIEENEQR